MPTPGMVLTNDWRSKWGKKKKKEQDSKPRQKTKGARAHRASTGLVRVKGVGGQKRALLPATCPSTAPAAAPSSPRSEPPSPSPLGPHWRRKNPAQERLSACVCVCVYARACLETRSPRLHAALQSLQTGLDEVQRLKQQSGAGSTEGAAHEGFDSRMSLGGKRQK